VLEDFYTKPYKSSSLDIYAAKNNLGPLTLWRLDQVRNKCVKLWFKDMYM